MNCDCHNLSWDQCPTLLQEARNLVRKDPKLKADLQKVSCEGLASLERMRKGMEQIIRDVGLSQDRTDALCRSLDPPPR